MGLISDKYIYDNGKAYQNDELIDDGLDVYELYFSCTGGRVEEIGAFNLKDKGKFRIHNDKSARANRYENCTLYNGKYYINNDGIYSFDLDRPVSSSSKSGLLEPYDSRYAQLFNLGGEYAVEIQENGVVEVPVLLSDEKLIEYSNRDGVNYYGYFGIQLHILSSKSNTKHTFNGFVTSYSKKIDYLESTPQTSIIYPSGQTLDNHGQITFQWNHTTDKGWKPYGFDLQYSYNGVVWNDLASVSPIGNTTPQPTSYTAPAYTFDVGVVYWRVRTYNTLDVASEWAVGSFIADSAPDAPVIQSVTTTPVPTIQWTSNEQAAFRVTVGGLFDSGVIYGTATSYTAPTVLPDGGHIVTLSVANASGKWTASTASVTTANAPSGSIDLVGSVSDMTAALSWTKTGTFTRLYLLRDGVPIKDVTGLASTKDALFPGAGTYTVRGLIAGGNYTDSNSVALAEDTARSLSIVPLAAGNPVQLRYNLGARPQHDRSTSAAQEYTHYAGRALPVASLSGFRDVTHALNYAIESTNIHALAALVGKAVCIRDRYGRAFGVLESAQAKSGKRYTALTLSLTEIDYQEAVDYVV